MRDVLSAMGQEDDATYWGRVGAMVRDRGTCRPAGGLSESLFAEYDPGIGDPMGIFEVARF